MERRDSSIVTDVQTLIRGIQELKTAQFTSQNSGMVFRQAETLQDFIPFIQSTSYGGEVHLVTNYFYPEHRKPAICIPHFEMIEDGFRFEYTRDYSIGYYNIGVYDADNNYLGYADVWPMLHWREVSGGYGFQTIVYTWASANFSLPFKLSLRATDNGAHSVTVESAQL